MYFRVCKISGNDDVLDNHKMKWGSPLCEVIMKVMDN